jgi:oxaloacetate decarboxylase (Na+ extruding) subunit alpha
MSKPLAIIDVVLRDAHQSLLATRLRLADMLPIAAKLDKVGYWSLETWGGATFDACIRYLGEDPWERIRALKQAMPNTKQQMLLRGQNLLGYRHYADDVVEKFVERAHQNGVDVFRIFDAMNDVRNLQTAITATIKQGAHAQGTLAYTVSPVHSLQTWLDMAKRLQDLGVHSICIKDMAGLLKPYVCEELVSRLKESVDLPLAMQCHATTGLSTATYQKAIDAGIDILDTSISSMSMTYGHTATETIVAMLEDTPRDTGLDLTQMEEIATYFREIRLKYAQYEGSLKGIDARILTAQVPGGMLTNMESQLKEQNALDRLDEVLKEIPKVREDLGFIPLVTPTSQIVGTQSVLNVLANERYKTITKETAGVLKGEYGATAAPVNRELQQRVLAGAEAITCRPADLLEAEMQVLSDELHALSQQHGIILAAHSEDDVLTYALFPQVGLKFLQNRHDPDAFEKAPSASTQDVSSIPSQATLPKPKGGSAAAVYSVRVNGQVFQVEVAEDGELTHIAPSSQASSAAPNQTKQSAGQSMPCPLSGSIFKVLLKVGDQVSDGQVVVIMEAMKMETEIRANCSGRVLCIDVKEGDAVQAGQSLFTFC